MQRRTTSPHLLWSQHIWGLHFPTMALCVFVTSQKNDPRMVTCELSRVVCCLSQRQHNLQNMQFTRKREKLVKSRKTALGTFRKKSEKKKTLRNDPPPPRTRTPRVAPTTSITGTHHTGGAVPLPAFHPLCSAVHMWIYIRMRHVLADPRRRGTDRTPSYGRPRSPPPNSPTRQTRTLESGRLGEREKRKMGEGKGG